LAGASNESGVVDDCSFFGDLSRYFFGNFRDKASNIIWRYAAPFPPVIDCKSNDREWLFHVKIRFRPELLDSERLSLKNNCVKSNKHRVTDPYNRRQKCKAMSPFSGNINYF